MSMSTGQEGYASQAYRPHGDASEPRQKREAPRAETRAIASLGRRALVCLVDLAIIGAIGGALGGLAAAAIGVDALLTGGVALGWLAAIPGIGLVLMLAYIVMQATGGSLAQRWFDVRIVRAETGERVGFGRALGRHVLWALAGVIVVGYFSPLFDGSGRRQGWHDKATGTLVVDVSELRAAVREVAFAPLAPEHDASVASAAPSAPAPDAPPQAAASATAWAPVVPTGHPAAPAHPTAPVAAPTPVASQDSVAPQVPVAPQTPVIPQTPAVASAPVVPTAHPAPPAAPAVPPMPPAPAPTAGAADSLPADTPAAASAPRSHDSFAPPSPDESVVSDDTIALPPRGRPATTAPPSTSTPNAVPRDPFAPPESPAPGAQADVDPAPMHPSARETVAPPSAPPAPQHADPAPPASVAPAADPIDPMTVPVPPDDDVVDDTIVLNRRPAAPADALLSGDGFALTTDAAGLSILRSTAASDIAVTRGGAALDLPLGTSVRLAAGDVLTIGDRSITVGGA